MKKSASNKRALFVRVRLPNDQYAFLDVTRRIGGSLPFEKPVATCAMEVSKSVVAFSLIHLNRHSTEVMKERDLSFPAGAVARLVRKGNQFRNLSEDQVVVVVEGGEPLTLDLDRREDGKAVISESGPTFTLTRRPSRVDLFMKSPGTGRILAVGFGGHFGADGTSETVGRAAGKVLRSLSGLGAWKALSGISAIEMPRPTQAQSYGGVATPDNLSRAVRVRVLGAASDSDLEVLGEGEVTVELDMVNADPATQRLMFHIRPDDRVAAHWSGAHTEVVRVALDRMFAHNLGAELESMVYGIVLGELSDAQVRVLDQALHTVPPLDITPSQWRTRPYNET